MPKDKYDETGWQPWKNTKLDDFKNALPTVISRSEQYVIEVDYEKYGRIAVEGPSPSVV